MLTGLPTEFIILWMMISIIVAFFIGNAMNSILGSQGFGVVGNMLVLLSGFMLGFYYIDLLPAHLIPQTYAIPAAVAAAFVILFLLALIKKMVQRI